MAVGTLEWGAILGLLLLAFVFLPYYHRSRIFTTPEFLERRYNSTARLLFATAILLFEMIIYMPYMFYAGGLVLEVMFDIPLMTGVVGIAAFVGIYTTFGGLSAVVWTDFIQGILMLVGSSIVVIAGLSKIGGIGALFEQAPEHMHLPGDHPDYPFPATMIGGYFLITIYYWCQNQTIVQRTLAARTRWDALMGVIGACFIKLFLPFVIVLPGVLAFVLYPGLEPADKALPTLISGVVPVGLGGLIMAAIVASLMSSADSGLNSWATVFTNDIYGRFIHPHASPQRMVLVGRIASVVVLAVAVVRAPWLANNPSIIQYLLTGLAYLTAPIIVAFLLGLFWKKATSYGAVATMLVAPIVCYAAQHMHKVVEWWPQQTVYWLPIAVLCLTVFMIAVSWCTPRKSAVELQGLIWSRSDALVLSTALTRPLKDEVENGSGDNRELISKLSIWRDHRLMAMLACVLLVAVIWVLR